MENNLPDSPLAQCSSNICSSEIDEETEKKLRGDAIGDTLYSQSFLIKTLMKFSNVEWNEQFEEDLCFLWDMTLEKAVCEFLFKMSYPSLVCTAISSCDEQRFVEVVIGILANMFCADCEKSITREEVEFVLNVIHTDDWLILIQLMRFLTAVSSVFEDLSYITKDVLEKISFILKNSLNEELLTRTLEMVAKITWDCKLNVTCIDGDLIKSSFAGYKTLISKKGYKELLHIKYIVQLICNLCGYMSNFEDQISNNIESYTEIFVNTIADILRHYHSQKYLFPLTDEFDFFVEGASYLITTRSVGYNSSIFISIFKIINLLLKNDVSVPKPAFEIVTYLVYESDKGEVQNDLRTFESSDVKRVFDYIDECEYDPEYRYKEKYNELKVSLL